MFAKQYVKYDVNKKYILKAWRKDNKMLTRNWDNY